MRAIDECPPRGEVVQRPTEAAQQPRGSGPLPSTPARARGSSVRATPSLRPPRILGTISLFYRKEDRGKGRLRGRLQLFFLILVWGFPIVAAGILFDVDHLIQLYEILRLYVNFFQPSMKLIEKQRRGARVKKRYDRAQTPYQRILASDCLTKRKIEPIKDLYRKLDPVTLLKELERRQDHFWTFANGQREPEGNGSPREMDAVVRKYLAEISAAPESNQIRRYRRTKKPRVARTWRTREDPFVEVWPEVRVQLEVNPAQTAKALFIRLQQRHPCRFFDGQLRTLQRRVRDWRREQLYKAEISRVEPTFSEIGSDFAKEGAPTKGQPAEVKIVL